MMTFLKKIILFLAIVWAAGALLHPEVWQHLPVKFEHAEARALHDFKGLAALLVFWGVLLVILRKRSPSQTVFHRSTAMVMAALAVLTLAADLPRMRPSVMPFSRNAAHGIEGLPVRGKFERNFSPYYKARAFLSGRTLRYSGAEDVDKRLVTLSRMNPAPAASERFSGEISGLKDRRPLMALPASGKNYLLLSGETEAPVKDYFLVNAPEACYLVPEGT